MSLHAGDSGKRAGAPARRAVRTAGGEELAPGEPYVAAQAGRLPAQLGLGRTIDGFLAWRAYAAVRALWRLTRRVR